MNAQEFTISPNAISEIKKNILIRMLFLFAIVILFFFFIFPYIITDTNRENSTGTWLALLLIAPEFVYTFFTTLKKQKAMLASYKLIINQESISREVLNTPTITILKKEIQEIIKGSNGVFTILADSKLNAIGVPAQLERREELEQILVTIKPLTLKKSTSWLQKLQWPMALLVVMIMFATFYVSNKYLASLCGIVFSGFMIYSFIVIQKSKNVDMRTKRLSYVMLLPLLSVISAVIVKWLE